jgi:hypothetical protein
MGASKEIFAGSIVVLATDGNAEAGTTATGKICAGVAQEYKLCSSVAASSSIKVKRGVFRFGNGETITKAHIGDVCYCLDDQTVYRTATGKSAVGVIVDVDAGGVWVKIEAPLAAATTGLLAANNLSDVGTLATAQSNLGLTDGTIAMRVEDLVIDDDLTVGDDAAVTGKLDVTETITGNRLVSAGGAAYTLNAIADSGCVITTATDNAAITLPDAAAGNKGCMVTVINTGAAGAAKVSISPHSSDKIYGGIHGAAGGDLVTFDEVADKDIINTKATALKGDYATLVSDGSTGWYVIGGKGVWASEG